MFVLLLQHGSPGCTTYCGNHEDKDTIISSLKLLISFKIIRKSWAGEIDGDHIIGIDRDDRTRHYVIIQDEENSI